MQNFQMDYEQLMTVEKAIRERHSKLEAEDAGEARTMADAGSLGNISPWMFERWQDLRAEYELFLNAVEELDDIEEHHTELFKVIRRLHHRAMVYLLNTDPAQARRGEFRARQQMLQLILDY